MPYLCRTGPKILVLVSKDVDRLKQMLIDDFNACQCNVDDAYECATDGNTLIFITNENKKILKKTDIEKALLINFRTENILCKLLVDKKYNIITFARMAPRIIVMRSLGNEERVINQIKSDFNGEVRSLNTIFDSHNSGTIIVFTKELLNNPVSLSNLYKSAVHVNKNYREIMKELNIHEIKYLNIGLEKKDWYELTIKIYDSYGEYALHYKRLLKVIEELDLGLILGESWGKDAATILMSVGVYRIRFFTFHEPKYIKKILVGLEYLDDGSRIVDLDLYHKRKKIYWADIRKGKAEKNQMGIQYRKEIFSKLSTDRAEEIYEIERELLTVNKK